MISRLKEIPLLRKLFSGVLQAVRNSQGDWRYIYLPLMWKTAAFLTRRRVTRMGDIAFTLPCNNWITHFRWYLFARKEVEVRQFIDTHLKEGDVFFDIGANIGVFSLYACLRHKSVKVYSFEPEYSNLHLLKENFLANGLADRANIYSVAISDARGLSRLHIQDVTPGAACHSESREGLERTNEGLKVVWAEGVATMTVDALCEELGVVPNAMKIDTDGNEPKILQGAKKTLADPRLRSIAIEMHGEAICRPILVENGFKLVWSRPDTINQMWIRE
ncbi:MAG: FkbM family methyltransferase [Magnetococcales bacterium]|nr:FkbM family methyltransferase [Magnetococcales bacterium]